MNYLERLKKAKRIVVKVGTTTLTHSQTGKLNFSLLEKLVRQLVDLKNQGLEIILVSSGAVGAGMGRLGLLQKPMMIVENQALAAIGQGVLMHVYEKLFGEYGQLVAQILLTRSDMGERQRYLNARNTILTLFKYQVIPIINENDTVATEELRFGQNDYLSALVTSLMEADLLIQLSDIDGLYTADPRIDPQGELIPLVSEIDEELLKMAGGATTKYGTGGMKTKLEAAKIVLEAGAAMLIMNGQNPEGISNIFRGQKVGTAFVSRQPLINCRKRWLAYGPAINGQIMIDRGAEAALIQKGKSLLPSGIIEVAGPFTEGDLVSIVNMKHQELGRGLSNYSLEQLKIIKGKKSREIINLLGFKAADEAIHRDNLVITS